MNTERVCPNCRKPLPPDVPLGLCPECLIKSGLPTGSGDEPAARFVPPTVEEIAKLFPQLELLGFIGKGGMGAVYKARQPALDRVVALKVLPPEVANDPGFAERFNREARALARLNHPNIVTVYDFGATGPLTGSLHYLLMEYVDGANLREVERAGKLTPEQALAIVPQICEALQFAHNEGIVHRDIKPENLLLDKTGKLKITDFGIAKLLGVPGGKASLTGAKDVVGTPHYMAPEQIEKPQTVDHRADIYSLGVVFYEMLTGELPLGKFAPPSKKVQVDVRLDEVVLQTLEKEPERRYQQASQVKTAVENITTTPPAMGFAGSANPSPAPGPETSDKIILPAFLLAFFFGVFGAHRYYVGKIRTGLLQFGLLLAWIPMIVSIVIVGEKGENPAVVEPALALLLAFLVISCLVWALVDWILLLCKTFTDGQGRRITNWVHGAPGVPQPEFKPPGGAPPAGSPMGRNLSGSGAGTGMIVAPGIALIVAGALKLLAALKVAVIFGWPGNEWLNSLVPDLGSITPVNVNAFIVLDAVFKIIAGLLILFGGYQMVRREGYAWAIAAGIISIVACSLISFPIGIWALIVLARDDVKSVFNANASSVPGSPASARPKRFWAGFTVLIIGVLLFLGIVACCMFLAVRAMAGLFNGTAASAQTGPSAQTELSAQSLQKAGIYRKDGEFQKDFKQSFPFDPDGRFSIDDVNGRVEIQGWDSNLVVVSAFIHGKTAASVKSIEITVDSDPSRANVHTRLPSQKNLSTFRDWFKNNTQSADVDYTVHLPVHARVENASNVNGAVNIDGMADDITASTVNGAAHVKHATHNLKLSTVNGSLSADMDKLAEGQSVALDTVNGAIKLALPEDANAKFSMTTVNGSIKSDFSELAVKRQFPISSSLNGSLGTGDGSVKGNTVNGGIEILKAPAAAQIPASVPVVKPPDLSSNSNT